MRDLLVSADLTHDAQLPTRCSDCGFTWIERGASLDRCPRCHSAALSSAANAGHTARQQPPPELRPQAAPPPPEPEPNSSARFAAQPSTFPSPTCRLCDDAGLLVSTDERGNRFARDCGCRVAQRTARVLEQARIPRRYAICSLDNFDYGKSESIGYAWTMAHNFALGFPVETAGKGILFTGPPGLGKTHLAVSILRHVIGTGIARNGFFYEHKELLERLRSFYDLRSAGAENTLLRSLITCDLLVLDDLGEITPSEWAWDTTAYILNARYNENLSTLITTNRPNEPALASRPGEESSQLADARIAYKRETLGDRIGDRMRSRLMEMCVSLPLQGTDYRATAKRASFAS